MGINSEGLQLLGIVSFKVFGIINVVGLRDVFYESLGIVQSFGMFSNGTIALVSVVFSRSLEGEKD